MWRYAVSVRASRRRDLKATRPFGLVKFPILAQAIPLENRVKPNEQSARETSPFCAELWQPLFMFGVLETAKKGCLVYVLFSIFSFSFSALGASNSKNDADSSATIDAEPPLFRVLYLGDFKGEIRESGLFGAEDWVERSISWARQQKRAAALKANLPVSKVIEVKHLQTDAFMRNLSTLTLEADLDAVDLIVLDPGIKNWPLQHDPRTLFIGDTGLVHSFSMTNHPFSSSWTRHPAHISGREGSSTSATTIQSSKMKRLLRAIQKLSDLEWKHSLDVVLVQRPGMHHVPEVKKSLADLRVLSIPGERKASSESQSEDVKPVDLKSTGESRPGDDEMNEAGQDERWVASLLEQVLSTHITKRLTELPVNDVFDFLPISISDAALKIDGDDEHKSTSSQKKRTKSPTLSLRTARWALSEAQLAEGYAAAAAALGPWRLRLWDRFTGQEELQAIAENKSGQPFVRHAREVLQRPVDVRDFLLLLDDILAAGRGLLRGRRLHLPPSRLRGSGAFLHPHDVFRKKFKRKTYRVYPAGKTSLWIAPGKPVADVGRAKNGEILGPPWYRRFPNPGSERTQMKALTSKNPDFSARLTSLVKQLRKQKVKVVLDSTVRKQQRGYLMYGAFWLSQATSEQQVNKRIRVLRKLNRKWKLKVRIRWRHPDGWQATVNAAREMKDTYGVVYATRRGAEKSDHYDGKAVDVSVPFLPRRLRLTAPDGAKKTFYLQGAEAARDLSLSPKLVEWIDEHFAFEKLKGDYPHWSDAANAKP
ncbi:MAG: hypothetical protein GY822_07345 [Deltaproteobacteria bacterium]|nr:hypothetical protein [Deltaproteobacteria bacterium]